jgi:hypothetical protein
MIADLEMEFDQLQSEFHDLRHSGQVMARI